MTAADRRLEIISILVVSGHTTSKELAQEFGVTRRTILHDVSVLSYGYPVYTKPGYLLQWKRDRFMDFWGPTVRARQL